MDGLLFPTRYRIGGCCTSMIQDPKELQQLTAFFAWTAWASVANRPGKSYSYTNNFPYDPMVGNTPTSDAILWSALSLITLLAGTAIVLFAFGKFDFLGWKGKGRTYPSPDAPWDDHRKPESHDQVFCRRGAALFGSGPGGRSNRPLPRRPGQFLWHRSLRVSSRAISSAPGTCSWPSSGSPRPISPGGFSSPSPWEEENQKARPRGSTSLCGIGHRRLRQSAG